MKTTYQITLSVELTDNHCDEIVALFDAFLKRHHEDVQHANCDVRSSFWREPVEHTRLFGPQVSGPEPQRGYVPPEVTPAPVPCAAPPLAADEIADFDPDAMITGAGTRTIEIDKDTVYGALRELVKTKGAAAAANALKAVGAAKFTEVAEKDYAALYAAIEAQA